MANENSRRWSGLAMFSTLLHVVWLVIIVWLVWRNEWGIPSTLHCPPCNEAVDAIHAASEMGRLDMVSLALTVLGVVLAIGAFGGFFLMRSAAINAAHDEIAERMEKHGEEWTACHVENYMKENGARLIGAWLNNNPGALKRAIELTQSVDDETLDTDAMIAGMDEDENESDDRDEDDS